MSCHTFSRILCNFLAIGADAGVGDDDVEAAELLNAAVHRGLQRIVVSDVDLSRHDATVEAFDQIRCFGEVFGR